MYKNLAILFSISVICLSSIAQGVLAQNTYTWKSVITGGGGFVPGIIYHPTTPGLVYARTDVGGAYRWDDSAGRWIPLTDMMNRNNSPYMGILSIALDPSDTNRVYMETGEYTQSWAGYGAILSSTDKGNTWTMNALSVKIGGNEDGRGAGERLQVDPNADSLLFMGTTANGLWKSMNFAASWAKVSSFTPTNVDFVIFDPSSATFGNPTQRIFVGAVDTSGKSLYESTDGGTTWVIVPGQPHGVMAIRAAIADSLLYISFSNYQGPNSATAGSVWKYNISSAAWTNVSPTPAPPAQGGYSGISLYPQNPNYIIVSTLDCWYPMDEVYLSTDGGAHWTGKLRNGMLDHSYAPYTSGVTPHWLACVAMDPFDSSKAMFGTGFGIWACDNLFTSKPTWYFKDQNLEEMVPFQLISPPFTNLLSVMADYDGFRHDNLDLSPPQGRWNPPKGTTYSIAFAGKVPSKIVKAYSSPSPYGAYSTDGGSTWHDFAGYPSGATAGGNWGQLSIAISADGNTILWSPPGASTSYSTDNGKTWATCIGGVPAAIQPEGDPINPNKFYVFDALSSGQVWVSTDGGRFFIKGVSSLPRVPSYQDGLITTVPGQEGDLWICTGGGLYHSTDAGSSASKLSSLGSAYLLGIGKSLTAGGYPALYLWGVVNGTLGIYRSDNTGTSWTRINDDSHQFGYLHFVTGDPRVYGRCYVTTDGRGILYGEPANSDTTDNPTSFNLSPGPSDSLRHYYQNISASWSRASDPQGKALTYIMHFFGNGVDTSFATSDTAVTFSAGNILASSRYALTGSVTNGFDTTASANAVWFVTASSLMGVRQASPPPTSFALNQNFPNPFNPETTISYQLAAVSHVTLKVYDVLGRNVKTLVDEVKKPGRYETEFDTSQLASGVYFCTLHAGDFSQTKKLTLLK